MKNKNLTKDEKLEISFKQFREIAKYITIECPHCGDMYLLSEAKYQLKAEKIKSWLEKYNKRLRALSRKEEKLQEKTEKLEKEKMLMLDKMALLREEVKTKKEEMDRKIAETKADFLEKKKEESKKAIASSKGIKLGNFLENWVPYFEPLFKKKKYNPCDYVFLGKPVDFIVFEGMEAGKIKKMTFLEIKSGAGGFTRREKEIRDCIKKGEVGFEAVKIKDVEMKMEESDAKQDNTKLFKLKVKV